MEYTYYNVELGWDEETDRPVKIYTHEKRPLEPDPETLFDEELGKDVLVKRYFDGGPMGYVH